MEWDLGPSAPAGAAIGGGSLPPGEWSARGSRAQIHNIKETSIVNRGTKETGSDRAVDGRPSHCQAGIAERTSRRRTVTFPIFRPGYCGVRGAPDSERGDRLG